MDFAGKIELHESSGPVSPRYQYSIDLVVSIAAGTAKVTCNRGEADVTADVSKERSAKLLTALDAHDFSKLGGDLVEDKRGREGVSFNHFLIARDGQPEVRLDYLLPRIGLAENAPRKAFIDLLKAFADEVAPEPAAALEPTADAPPVAPEAPPSAASADAGAKPPVTH